MSLDSPVQVSPRSPAQFDRIQVLLRIGIAAALAWLGVQGGGVAAFAFLTLPVIAAVEISTLGGARYLDEVAPTLWAVIAWSLRFHAYMTFLVDRFPTGDALDVDIQIACGGRPTVSSALARFVTSIPSALMLSVLACASSVLWPIAALFVLVQRRVPRSILACQRAVLRWAARLLAYHASLVAEYPPWALDTGAPPRDMLAGAAAR